MDSNHIYWSWANDGDGYDWWYYSGYDDDEESSSVSPVIWGIGGMLLGALIMGLIVLYLRKKGRLNKPQAVPVEEGRDELLRRRSQVEKSSPGGDTSYSNEVWNRNDAGMTASFGEPLVNARSVEVYSAESIPGETMGMLTERVCGYLRNAGVRVDMKEAGKILASYASNGGVRLSGTRGVDPSLLRRAAIALSEFFCVSMPGSHEIADDYLPANSSVPQHTWIELNLERMDRGDRENYGGIGRETFRGILREAEEEHFLPEEEWKRIDMLLSHYTGTWFTPARHQTIRNIENITTCLLAAGATLDETLDYAIYQALFLRVHKKIGRRGMTVMGEAFEELFQDREMPLCRNFLADYIQISGVSKDTPATETTGAAPTAETTGYTSAPEATDSAPKQTESKSEPMPETPEIKNQTIDGGEYESIY